MMKMIENMGAPGGVEPPTNGLGNRCSIQLSYGATLTKTIHSQRLSYLRKPWQWRYHRTFLERLLGSRLKGVQMEYQQGSIYLHHTAHGI
jgi:hypothetical protein